VAYLEGANLVAAYGVVPILHECSVEVEKGELAVIVGPNGAGKSTVMRVLLGMLEATSGSVTLEGKIFQCFQLRIELVKVWHLSHKQRMFFHQ
jgi:branched-chain amino acid transport system ATP-binding protein